MKAEIRILAAVVENLNAANTFIEGCADRSGLAAEKKFGLLLALEEVFVNICHYAYPGGAGDVEIKCSDDGTLFVLEISDNGRPFDVLSRPEPDTELDIMDRPIGGLGIHLVRKLSDAVSYARQGDRNVLIVSFKK